ncbi:MAG: SAM-dependent methyltransferase, partial [Firmicutes bacterium]|nr:SAM-dependent methyltransferase [Bacillota bacterium]
GTPAISDPGHLLVRAAWEAGVEVLAVAGPSAVAAALCISGFDAREFAFYGFLPREKGDLRKKLLDIIKGPAVAVAYESPHRVAALVEAVNETLPGCGVCACCDLTKLHEKTLRGSAAEVLDALQSNPKAEKGEYCVVLDLTHAEKPTEPARRTAGLEAQLFDDMLSGMDSQAAVEAAVQRGARRNDAKRAALRVKGMLERER